MAFKKNPSGQLASEQVKIIEIADAIIKEGTSYSTSGNWISEFSRFGEEEQFAREHYDEIVIELVSREEVCDVWEDESGFDVTYYTDYVENYEPFDEDMNFNDVANTFYDYTGRSVESAVKHENEAELQ